MMISRKIFIVIAAGILSWDETQSAVINVNDSLRDYAVDLRNQSLDDVDVATYQAPSAFERGQFATMASHIASGNLAAADAIAGGLGYEVVNFTDTDTANIYYHLREVTVGGKVSKGWGSYFYNPNKSRNALIQAPHIRHDTHSYDVATVAFQNTSVAALMFNGAHRNSGGNNNADVAHLATSIFQTVHETWTTNVPYETWQIHGFNLGNHPNIPAGTDVVLSSGDGGVSNGVKVLDAAFENVSFIGDAQSISHAYNTLPVNHPDNVAVNGGVVGTAMDGLGGTTNVQGIYTRSLGGEFIHIELEQSIRLDQNLANDLLNRETAGIAIADAINTIPEPSSGLLIGFSFVSLCWLRMRGRKFS